MCVFRSTLEQAWWPVRDIVGRVIADGPVAEILGGGWYFSTETARILGGGALLPADGAPLLHGMCPGNLCYDWQSGDRETVERALASSAHRIELRLVNNRIFHLPLEPRAVAARYDPADERYTLWTTTQALATFK